MEISGNHKSARRKSNFDMTHDSCSYFVIVNFLKWYHGSPIPHNRCRRREKISKWKNQGKILRIASVAMLPNSKVISWVNGVNQKLPAFSHAEV